MAQTTITYTYDTAGNRTGRSAPVQTMAGVTDIPSVESVAISKIVSQLMATPVNGVLLSKEAVSIPVRSETALWAAGPFPGEQNRSLSLTKGITDDIGSGSFVDYVKTHPLYMHEYGHTIDSRSYGPAYLFAIGIPSLISVSNNAPVPGKIAWSHDYKPYEMRANRNAEKYFGKYYGVSWSNPYGLYDFETYFPTHL